MTADITDINSFRGKHEGKLVADRIASKVADGLMDDLMEYDEKLKNGPYTALDKALEGKTPAEQIVIIAAVGDTLND